MDIYKLTAEEARTLDLDRNKEVVEEIRREISEIRVKPFDNPSSTSTKKKRLRKSLARLLTAQTESRKKAASS